MITKQVTVFLTVPNCVNFQVASFTGEKQAVSEYSKFLVEAYVTGVHEGYVAGVALGTVTLLVFSGYALAVWFGSKMIMENEKKYNGSTVCSMSVLLC